MGFVGLRWIRRYGPGTLSVEVPVSRPLVLAVLSACTSPDPSDGPHGDRPSEGADVLAELTAFQAVAVPLVADGAEVPSADRSAPLVASRPGVVRARLELPAGVDAVELTLELGGASFTATGAAGEDLVVEVPAAAFAEDARYAVRISADGAELDRFPDAGDLALDAIATGVARVHLVPFEVDGFVPDTSAAVVDGYRAALLAMYPVPEVEITVGEPVAWDEGLDLGGINVAVGVMQEEAMFAGASAWDVTWYGMVSGVATREEFDGITGTSEDGGDEELTRAYFAAGAAFGDQKSEDTFVHEIGHTWRLLHTDCGEPNDPDPAYPHAGGTIGVEGWDVRTGSFLAPSGQYDLMGYCFPRWVSDYSYAKLAAHVQGAQHYDELHP